MYWSLIKFADVFKVRVLAEIYRKFSKICSVNFKTAILGKQKFTPEFEDKFGRKFGLNLAVCVALSCAFVKPSVNAAALSRLISRAKYVKFAVKFGRKQ